MRHPNIPAMPRMMLPSREGPFTKASQGGMWSYRMPEVKHMKKTIHRIPVGISPGYEGSLNCDGRGVTGFPYLSITAKLLSCDIILSVSRARYATL